MFCEKCGTKLSDGERFCHNCGAPLNPLPQPDAEQAQPQPQADYAAPAQYDQQPQADYAAPAQYDQQPQADYAAPAQYGQQSYADPAQYGQQPYAGANTDPVPVAPYPADGQFGYVQAPEKPRKKVNKKRIAIIAAAIVACVGIFIAIALATGMFKSDKDRMRDVTNDAVDSLLSNVSDLKDNASLDKLGNFTLDIQPGTAIKSIGESSGLDLSWINDMRVDVATDNTDGKVNSAIRCVVNDVEIAQLNLVVDPQKGEILLGVDGLSDSLARIETGFGNRVTLGNFSQLAAAASFEEINKVLNDIDTDEVIDIIEDYVDAALKGFDDVERSSGSVTAAGVTGDCTVYTIKISQKTLMNIAQNLIEKAADDSNLKDLLEKVYPAISASMGSASSMIGDFDSFYSYFQSSVKQAGKSIDAYASQASSETMITVEEYADDNKLTGMKITANGNEVFFGYAEDGDKFGIELTAMGNTFVRGTGTKDGDALSGDIRIIYNDTPMLNIKLIGYNADDRKGAVELSLSKDAVGKLGADSQAATALSTLSLRVEKDGDDTKIDLGAMGQSAFTATMTPVEKKSVSVNTNLPVKDSESWAESLDFEALKDRLIRAGMPEEMLGGLLAAAGVSYIDPDDPFAGEDDIELTVWASDVDSTRELCREFAAQYPDKNIDISIKEVSEADTTSMLLNDSSAAADVFGFPSDQVSNLYNLSLLSPIDYDIQSEIYSRDSEASVEAASVYGDLAAYPLTGENGYYLVYDKRYVTDQDAETLEGVLKACRKAKKKFIMDAGNGFYSCVFPFTGGLKLNGMYDETQQFNNYDENAVLDSLEAFNKLFVEYKDVFVSDNVDKIGTGIGKTAAAGIDGSWNIANVQKILGANYGAAKLPTINIKGTDTQMISMNGCKLIGVNAQTRFPNAAHLLADYLTDEESQLKRAEVLGWSPSNKAAASSSVVTSNSGMTACLEQAQYSVAQKEIAYTFWTPMGTLGNNLWKNGALTRAQLKTAFENCISAIKDE